MIINNSKGLFITIDGANGSGKSTLLKCVIEKLQDFRKTVVVTREPTDTDLGRFIREGQETIKGKSLASLVVADRYQHIENVIQPNLEKGNIVVSDRYIASSLVYQVIDNLSYEFILKLNSEILIPDLSIILNVSEETLTMRLSERKHLTRFEHVQNKHSEVSLYKKALGILSEKGFNMIEIDNQNNSIEDNANIIVNEVKKLVNRYI